MLVIGFGSAAAPAQNADNRTAQPGQGREEEWHPKPVRERLKEMQIERDKKEHEEMLERGDKALALSKELEESLAHRATIDNKDLGKLEDLEKLVKKIRSDLGGGDDGGEPKPEIESAPAENNGDVVSGFRSLQKATVRLVDELQKTTRFSISAAAIQSSNSVLRIVRFLRLRK
jgi:hypothetical protein